MEFFLVEIEKALNAGLYFIALQSTLTLPDICAALMSPNGKTKKEKYIRWYDTYAKESGQFAISGEECYYFRCSCLHQGSTQSEKSEYSRIIFVYPNNLYVRNHNCIIFDSLTIDIDLFCQNMISAVRTWENRVKDDPVFRANYPNLLRIYPDGFANYFKGVPVIT